MAAFAIFQNFKYTVLILLNFAKVRLVPRYGRPYRLAFGPFHVG